ncbi:malonate decarboxylase subunit epsilon [Streptomyces sp. NPDC088554]|uniref:malonate decarboxylase subunit epsilon n=1 Tax=Streptomyces sp. NPDC088554 TaxID=3365865 RepID=UPI00382FC831
MSSAFLFPGQGEQYPGMLHDLPAHPSAAAVLDEISAVLGHDVRAHDDERALRSNASVQLALFASGVAAWRTLDALGARPDYVAGHSIGSFAAAVAAGALALPDAVTAVRARGHAMETAYPHGYGMGVVLGLDERTVTRLAEQAGRPAQPVYATNVNAPRQIAVSGADPSVDRLLALALANGAAKARRLAVDVPSHCPLMAGPEQELAAVLSRLPLTRPRIPWAGNRGGRTLRSADAVREDLVHSVAHPVRWHDATSVLHERGVRLFVQVWPGDSLARLARAAFPDARATSMRAGPPEHILQLIRRVVSA